MTTSVILPSLGAGVKDVTVLRWMKTVGEPIQRGETLVEVETDKIATEICAEADGTVLEIGPAVGDRVPTGAVLAVIGPAPAALLASPILATAPANQQSAIIPRPSPVTNHQSPTYRGPVSPVVSRLVAEHRLDLNAIAGTGQDGRITKQDVLAHLERCATAPAAPAQLNDRDEPDDSEIEPVSVMRSRIAEHMVASQRAAPHVTTVWEVDFGGVMAHRAAHKAEAERAGIRLTPLAYVVCAVAGALREHPAANSQWRNPKEGRAGIAHMRDVHLGLAVAVDAGLLVPVIRHADALNVSGAARTIHDLATRARVGALTPADMQGATFTLSNHGVAGSLLATPIIPQPQSGILGLGAVEKRVRVLAVDGADAIAIRPCAYLSYTFDHRILDGALADAFMASVKSRLEAW
ncbi:MAG: 2-oxo acid dehydrogenase subunit E2 [Anaerolineales bacterium]|nr:2-oxo acid dehydrogenase subunit E2 [Anaerolineales bacterium]